MTRNNLPKGPDGSVGSPTPDYKRRRIIAGIALAGLGLLGVAGCNTLTNGDPSPEPSSEQTTATTYEVIIKDGGTVSAAITSVIPNLPNNVIQILGGAEPGGGGNQVQPSDVVKITTEVTEGGRLITVLIIRDGQEITSTSVTVPN